MTALHSSIPVFDVRAFGAAGDKCTHDTRAIQSAIDACAQQGGGRVCLHAGTFLSSGLQLRSHVEIHLTSTATLQAIPDIAAYLPDKITPYHWINRSLLWAKDCEHISVTGSGTIHGAGDQFGTQQGDVRPVMIRFRACRQVRIEDVFLRDYPAFGVHLIQCRQVHVDRLRIDSQIRPNSDGIDIDGCQEVFIRGCSLTTKDDCIALKSLEPGHPCRDIIVSDCRLSSHCAAIRVGPDAVSAIESVTVTNCLIRDTGLGGIKIQQALGSVMRNLNFNNLVMDNVAAPIAVHLGGWKKGSNVWAVFDDSAWDKGRLENVQFSHIQATVPPLNAKGIFRSCIQLNGAAKARPRAITFSNLRITFPGGGTAEEAARREVPEVERAYPEVSMFGVLPAYGIYLRHADEVVLENIRFETASDELRPALVADDVRELDLRYFTAQGNANAESLIRLINVRQARLTHSRALVASATQFVQIEGAASTDILCQ